MKVGAIVDKLEDKLPDSVKSKVEPITDKIFGKDGPDDAATPGGESIRSADVIADGQSVDFGPDLRAVGIEAPRPGRRMQA